MNFSLIFSENKFILFFFGLVLLIGALGYLPWVLATYGLFPESLVLPSMLIGGLSPTFATVITLRVQSKKSCLKVVFRGFTQLNFSKFWLLGAIILAFATTFFPLVLLLTTFAGTNYVNLFLLIDFLPLFIISFLQNMWEEIGWRGYALPSLQKKYNALYSSIIVGIFWALWHWPHFLVKDSVMMTNYHNFFWFFVSTILASVVNTWLYNSTNGSLLTVTLYHASFNAFGFLFFLGQGISYVVFPYLLFTNFLVTSVVLLIFKPSMLSRNRKAVLHC